MCRETAHIDFELSGSELVALLMESAEIKRHYPIYNRAQKRSIKQFAIFCYEDRKGIKHLAFNTLKTVPRPLKVFYNLTDCRLFLKQICMDYRLCPKYCHLQVTEANCSFYEDAFCEGICSGKESVAAYNQKVDEAIANLTTKETGTRILKEKGRHENENAFVLMDEEQYKGYGFISKDIEIKSIEDVEAFVIPQKNTPETQRILGSYLMRKNKVELATNFT